MDARGRRGARFLSDDRRHVDMPSIRFVEEYGDVVKLVSTVFGTRG